ncbi:hypothetical protein SDC9_70654 [bioreactor metagenome]|uniref:Uncharacterized protein n=1 Tax=bioreactor metagenome TaxID=1076179 RepID=A0A644YCB1_9ZZZZ
MTHDFDQHDTLVAAGGGVQTVDGAGGDVKRGVEADAAGGAGNVVVDGFGDGDEVDPRLLQQQCAFVSAAAADADQRFELVFMISFDDGVGHVEQFFADRHLVRFVAAGPQNGAADGEDAGEGVLIQRHPAVKGEALETVLESGQAVSGVSQSASGGPDRGVQSGAVAARGQNSNTFAHFFRSILQAGGLIRIWPSVVLRRNAMLFTTDNITRADGKSNDRRRESANIGDGRNGPRPRRKSGSAGDDSGKCTVSRKTKKYFFHFFDLI